MSKDKVVIVGAGSVGSTTAYSLMLNGQVSEITLVDIDKEKVKGEVMDLVHCSSFVKPVKVTSGDYRDCRDASIIIIAAGVKEKPVESRLDLLERNASIFQDMMPQIVEELNSDAILLVVTNPVDVLSYVTWKISGLPQNRVIGSGTLLDSSRFHHILSKNCNIDARNINAYVIGEHGDSELVAWNSVSFAGIEFDKYCKSCNMACELEGKEGITEEVRCAGYKILEKKGATYYAIASAVNRIVECILRDENSILPVSTLMQGQYGLKKVYLSLPIILNRTGVREVIELDLSPREKEKLIHSAEVLQNEITKLGI